MIFLVFLLLLASLLLLVRDVPGISAVAGLPSVSNALSNARVSAEVACP
jgi:hypothetical protein